MRHTYLTIRVKKLEDSWDRDSIDNMSFDLRDAMHAWAGLTITTQVYSNGDAHISGALYLLPCEYEVIHDS